MPGPVGVKAIVHEIPDDFAAAPQANDVDQLLGDLQQYVAFFSSPDDTIRLVKAALTHAIGRQLIVNVGAVALAAALLGFLLGRRRGRQVSVLALRAAPWVAVAALLAVSGTTAVVMAGTAKAHRIAGARVLEGTPLAGTRVTGRLGGVLETYGAQLVDVYRENEDFYASVRTNFALAWDERMAADPAQLNLTTPLTELPAETLDNPEVPLLAQSLPLGDATDWITMVVVADIHCNFSMSPLVGDLVRKSGAEILLHAGDATIDGTAVEEICPSSLEAAVPDGTAIVYAGGNHDSETTASQFASEGATVLRGKNESIEGVTVLGDLDPYATRIGQGTTLARDETADQVVSRLSQVACDDRPDILLIHNPYVAADIAKNGCVDYTISGHLHRRIGPQASGSAIEYVNASSAGAIEGQPTLGPLHGIAEVTVLRFDPVTRAIVDYRVVSVYPDANVMVSALAGYPVPESLVRELVSQPDEPADQQSPAPAGDTTDTEPAGG
ncbi:hypothetical protein GCM10010401_19460 [Rarobacter faecitabidus]